MNQEIPPVPPTPPAPMPAPLPEEPKRNNMWLIVGIVLVVLCCCIVVAVGGAVYLYQNGDKIFGTGMTLLNML